MDEAGARSSRGAKARVVLDVASSVLMLCAAGAILWVVFFGPQRLTGGPAPPEVPLPTEPLSVADAPVLGDPNAQVGIVLFSDFECPFCAKFARETLPELKRKYVDTGKAFLVFRHLPLPIHKNAQKAAEAAECGAQQGKFWDVHDAMFGPEFALAQFDWSLPADWLGLDRAQFLACLDAGMYRGRVAGDAKLAAGLQIRGTPTLLVGTRGSGQTIAVMEVIGGALPLGRFTRAIEAIAR